jgi:hypothetical protein
MNFKLKFLGLKPEHLGYGTRDNGPILHTKIPKFTYKSQLESSLVSIPQLDPRLLLLHYCNNLLELVQIYCYTHVTTVLFCPKTLLSLLLFQGLFLPQATLNLLPNTSSSYLNLPTTYDYLLAVVYPSWLLSRLCYTLFLLDWSYSKLLKPLTLVLLPLYILLDHTETCSSLPRVCGFPIPPEWATYILFKEGRVPSRMQLPLLGGSNLLPLLLDSLRPLLQQCTFSYKTKTTN